MHTCRCFHFDAVFRSRARHVLHLRTSGARRTSASGPRFLSQSNKLENFCKTDKRCLPKAVFLSFFCWLIFSKKMTKINFAFWAFCCVAYTCVLTNFRQSIIESTARQAPTGIFRTKAQIPVFILSLCKFVHIILASAIFCLGRREDPLPPFDWWQVTRASVCVAPYRKWRGIYSYADV